MGQASQEYGLFARWLPGTPWLLLVNHKKATLLNSAVNKSQEGDEFCGVVISAVLVKCPM